VVARRGDVHRQIIDGGKLECDLPTLVDTRLLIQANSGGGKSWLLRLIAERAGGLSIKCQRWLISTS
jgi:hypothetical protein